MKFVSRRRWLLSTAVSAAALTSASTYADDIDLRVATTTLPGPSRTVRLESPRESQTVITAIAADPRGEFVAVAGDDHTIRILRSESLQRVATLRGHKDLIRTLSFDPDGSRLVSAGNDGQVIFWDCQNSFRITQRMQGTPVLACVRFAPQRRELAAVGFASDVYIIGRSNGSKAKFHCDCSDLRAVDYRDDGQVLAVAGRSGDLYLYDPDLGRLLSEHRLHQGRIQGLEFHRQSNAVIAVGEDGFLTVFDTEQRTTLNRVKVTTGKLFAAAVINSQLVAVAGSDNVIRIINTDEGTVVRHLTGHQGSVSSLAVSGGILFSGSYDATLRRWSVEDVNPSRQRIAGGDPRIDR